MHPAAQYFPALRQDQIVRYDRLDGLYREWNAMINVISRKDIDHLFTHHILHSLSIAKVVTFKPGTRIMDAGTGGGFPGIPLAIMFPDVHFTLVDSIGKKIRVVRAIAVELGLSNVTALNTRAEQVKGQFDFVTGRAVSSLPSFFSVVRKCVISKGSNDIPNGILYLTGGGIETELAGIPARSSVWSLAGFFPEQYFTGKKLVHLYNFL